MHNSFNTQNRPGGVIHAPALDFSCVVWSDDGDAWLVCLLFGDVQDTLKSLVRTALVPREGHVFAVSEFSAIEAQSLIQISEPTRLRRNSYAVFCLKKKKKKKEQKAGREKV